MPLLQLEIVSEHRKMVGNDAIREFGEEGGTIGRSLQNDWILPDPDRFISGRHATIDYKGGIYYLVDTSTNGVYVNGDCEPLGKGNARRLFNGDRLRLGDVEIAVTIDSGESLQMPAASPSQLGEHSASVVEDDALESDMMLLDEDAITGDDEFQSALFGSAADNGVTADRVQSIVAEAMQHEPVEPQPLKEADLVATELLDSFLDGVGIERSEFHPSTDLNELMYNAGEVFREFVDGATQLLASRANMKNAFRLDQTTVLPRRNNPIKLSANVKDSIKQLLIGREGEYLGPRDAVREVCRDLLFHQDALLDAMTCAFIEFADRFDPDELRVSFDRTLNSGFLTRFLNKSKYWPMYVDQYRILIDKGEGRFPQMYAEEFVRAYERYVAEYKRLGGDEHLKATVVLNKNAADSNAEPARIDIEATAAEFAAIDAAEMAQLEQDRATEDSANDDEAVDSALEHIDDGADRAGS